MRKKREDLKINKKLILLSLSIILLAFIIATTFSKYVIEKKDTHIQESTAFYFESEVAEVEEGKNYEVNDWDGKTTKIEFDVKNFTNSLLKTEQEITYTITASVEDYNEEDGIKDSELLNLEIKNVDTNETISNGQKCILLNGGLNTNNYELNISPTSDILESSKVFKIKLVIGSIKPYTKELISNITLKVNKADNYELTLISSEDGEYETLNIKVNNPNEDLTIKYDNTKLVLDKSSYLVNALTVVQTDNTNSFTISKTNLQKGQDYEINFIKQGDVTTILGTDIKTE